MMTRLNLSMPIKAQHPPGFAIASNIFQRQSLSQLYQDQSLCTHPIVHPPILNIFHMFLPIILIYAPFLLSWTMADTQLTVLVPDKWKDTATVNGLDLTTGMSINMTRETSDAGSVGICPCIYNSEEPCPESCETLNYGVAKFHYPTPTTESQYLKVILDDYTLEVSPKNDFH